MDTENDASVQPQQQDVDDAEVLRERMETIMETPPNEPTTLSIRTSVTAQSNHPVSPDRVKDALNSEIEPTLPEPENPAEVIIADGLILRDVSAPNLLQDSFEEILPPSDEEEAALHLSDHQSTRSTSPPNMPVSSAPKAIKKSIEYLVDHPSETAATTAVGKENNSSNAAKSGNSYGHLAANQAGKPRNKVAVKAREYIIGKGRACTPVMDTDQATQRWDPDDEEAELLEYANRSKLFDNHQRIQAIQLRHKRGIQVPFMLDGVVMLHKANVTEPLDVFLLDISNSSLRFVIPDELSLFTNLHTLRAGENVLPFAKLGAISSLRKLSLPFNEISDLDLEVDGLFLLLEQLDLSYNHITPAALIVLSTLPVLKFLDLTANKISSLPIQLVRDMANWREKVIELLLPKHVAMLDATLMHEFSRDWTIPEVLEGVVIQPVVHDAMRKFLEGVGETGGGHSKSQSEHVDLVDGTKKDAEVLAEPKPLPPPPEEKMPQPEEAAAQNFWAMPPPPGPIAFEALESLVLERNQLHSVESLQILGRLPSLKNLNLNHNRIQSFEFLSEHQKNDSHSPPPPFLIEKYAGFPCLEELRIAFNKIDSVQGILSVVWMPVLQSVWIEGNPVFAKNGKCVVTPPKERNTGKPTDGIVSYSECDPLKLLPRVYNIQIQDLVFQPHHSVLEDTYYALAPVRKAGLPALRRIIRHTQEASKVTTFVHEVTEAVAPTAEELKERRREFKLTDDEVKETVRAGRVLTLKELKRIRKREEQEARAYEQRREDEKRFYEEEIERERRKMKELMEKDEEAKKKQLLEGNAGTVMQPDIVEEDQAEVQVNGQTDSEVSKGQAPVEIRYDPNSQDATFLTGVHITGGNPSQEIEPSVIEAQAIEPPISLPEEAERSTQEPYEHQQSNSQAETKTAAFPDFISESESFGDTSSDSISSFGCPERIALRLQKHGVGKGLRVDIAANHAFPKCIQASIRALRHAVTNPVSYWRVVEDSYAKPTFAHAVRVKDAVAEAAAAGKAAEQKRGLKSKRLDSEQDDYKQLIAGHRGFDDSSTEREKAKPPASATISETSSVADARQIPESGNISPSNTMWSVAAAKFRTEREAAVAAANRAAKNVGTTAKMAGDAKVAKAVTTNVKADLPHEQGVFLEEDAVMLAQKLGKEQLRHRITVMNESENETDLADDANTSNPPGGSEKTSHTSQVAADAHKSELIKRLERERQQEQERLLERSDSEEEDSAGMSLLRPVSNYTFTDLQRKIASNTPGAAAALAKLRASEYKAKQLVKEKKQAEAKRKGRPKDEFDEMKEMMKMMDSKIATIESNLAAVLKSDIMQKHVPQSRKLIDEVQAEYKRLEKMYSDSAAAAIEAGRGRQK
ncbi:hypothetical protein HDU81_007738 [Chytriomyces hyalinus]|nr:hypothetical protein HDU81_007738 [Chytriomyces hyalinus]